MLIVEVASMAIFIFLQTSEPGQSWESFGINKVFLSFRSLCFAIILIEGTSLVVVLRRQAGCQKVDVISDEEETGAEGAHRTSWRSEIL